MTLTQLNDYPTTRSRYLPSNSPAAESLSQGSLIEARKPYQNTSFGRKGRFGAPARSLRWTLPGTIWAQTPALRRRELNA